MKKQILILALLLCVGAVSLSAQGTHRETSVDGLKGAVRQINSMMYAAVVENESMRRGAALEHLQTVYNTKGQRRSMSFLSTEEEVMFRSRYKHDAFGVTILEQIVDNNDEVIARTHYIYDDQHVLTESYVEDAELQVENRIRYKYDASGRLIQRSYNDPLGQMYRREMYRYNPDGTILSSTIYNRQDQKVMELRYEYDRQGQPITKTVFDYSDVEPEVFVTLYRYQYDERGNWVQRTEYSVEGSIRTPEYITERSIQYFD